MNRTLHFTFLLVMTVCGLALPSGGQTTWYVDDDHPDDPGPGDPTNSNPLEDGSINAPYDSIQEAINAATYDDVLEIFDTVLVRDGTYTGIGNRDINFLGKHITVRSENGPESCFVNPQQMGGGFQFLGVRHRTRFCRDLRSTTVNGSAGEGSIVCDRHPT